MAQLAAINQRIAAVEGRAGDCARYHSRRGARWKPTISRSDASCCLGAEGPGLSEKALELADDVVYISQFGSVRSINAGAAAAVSMHAWIAQHATIQP